MKPKEVLLQFVDAFNAGDADLLAELYDENAVNHQVAYEPVAGKEEIKKFFQSEFARAKMVCIVENIFEDGQWAIMEWRDPLGLRGCGFFQVVSHRNWAVFSVASVGACAVSLCMQIFYTGHLVKTEDWSALMDTSYAVAWVAALLLVVTIIMNAITLVIYRNIRCARRVILTKSREESKIWLKMNIE